MTEVGSWTTHRPLSARLDYDQASGMARTSGRTGDNRESFKQPGVVTSDYRIEHAGILRSLLRLVERAEQHRKQGTDCLFCGEGARRAN